MDTSVGERIIFQEHKLRRSTGQQNQNLKNSFIGDGFAHYHGTQPRLERVAAIPEQENSAQEKTE